ncbi:hypothetical protein LL270_10705 [Pseudomonas aestusnigri]|uniref:hypothetical protein n=1 Tax=Halopseudomonas aestusnigri TaxID=857252 RepID=UPI001D19337A|nr:hypothetical protein [Halopseudomonas aestusnigri]MCC4261124.1 hypothetical protein [Halopseudomonas aestusnigri]
MLQLCVVGLPKELHPRLVGALKKHGIQLTAIIAAKGKRGSYMLTPCPAQAVHHFSDFTGKLDADMSDSLTIALPYADIPDNLDDEIYAYGDLGGQLHDDESYWPAEPKGKPDTVFFNAIFDNLMQLLPLGTSKPSDTLKAAIIGRPQLILAARSLDKCDEIPSHRHHFIELAASAFKTLVDGGLEGRIDEYFNQHGITHAQTGGITSTLKVKDSNGEVIYEATTQTHLKQGDGTTNAAAVRIYYHHFVHHHNHHIVITHAGPHPSRNITSEATI